MFSWTKNGDVSWDLDIHMVISWDVTDLTNKNGVNEPFDGIEERQKVTFFFSIFVQAPSGRQNQ